MKIVEWNEEKNILLKNTRGVSFEEVEEKIILNDIIDIISNPSDKFQHQKFLY